ncbi:MAG: radical SAM protein [Candidatus Eisenbacteria bacterium]|nr:radical SAM protein [Candidatus Eisenbacteria bacterium]
MTQAGICKSDTLRASEFNLLIPPSRDTPCLLLNTMSGNLLAFDQTEQWLATALVAPSVNLSRESLGGHLDALQSQGFVVPRVRKERKEVLRRLDACRFNSRAIGLTIMTTSQCNFACRYCFQNHSNRMMSAEVADQIVARFARESHRVDSIGITWFGGEPLLNPEVIERISTPFRKLFSRFDAGIISNGYRLDGSAVEMLVANGVTSAQITMDGPKAFHDVRRPTLGGGSTYNQVFHNIVDASKRLRIIVRINADGDLLRDPATLASFMCEMDDSTGGRVSFSFAPVVGLTDRPRTVECADLTKEEFAAGVEAVFCLALAKGFNGWIPWVSMARGCTATSSRSYTVDPDGLLFRCWEEPTGDAEQPVGHVGREEQSWAEYAHETMYLGFDEPHASDCSTCVYESICGSGCPRSSLSPHHYGKAQEACAYTYSWVPMLARTVYRAARQRGGIVKRMGGKGNDGTGGV